MKLFILLGALALAWPLHAATQLKVIISGGFTGAYEKLLPDFERTSGIKVTTGSGASQGTGPQTIGAQLARGEPYDVVILSRQGLEELIAAGRIASGTDVSLARALLAVGVRAGAAKPDVTTVEGFKDAVTKARVVATPGSTSGIFLTQELLPRLGLSGKANVKITPRATGAAAMVASGEADMTVMPVSEIQHSPGVELAGILPAEIQLVQTFSAAMVEGSKQPDAARALIRFLSSPQAAAVIRQSGMEPIGGTSGQAMEGEVRSAMQAWVAAYNSRDPARITGQYARDAVLWGTRSKTIRATPDAIAEYFHDAGTRPSARVTVQEQHTRVFGDVGVNSGTYTFSDVRNGKPVSRPARFTMVFHRRAGTWTLVDHHSSEVP